ncbi:hypothetical protein AMATHDRAFT_4554 [Amanita thiersii Skay4041]|uniref:Uncharacterized protein n=1 Tax=Amanita thiersii Skay4041 TaxID=703135 RepID=A0A2A9NGP2_9AGAR|nr:hypothetical protein AMATHDRAFT_4554 [Amanita thiersii Skay4041]
MALSPTSMTSLLFLFFIAQFATLALANTEIVNFAFSDSLQQLPFPAPLEWPILSQQQAEHIFNVTPAPSFTACDIDDHTTCPYQVWAVLNAGGATWSAYSKFTLRISWPAMFPTDFSIRLFSSQADPRTKYARIRIVFDGVFTPANNGTHPFLPYRTTNDEELQSVPFFLNFEPLYFGVLPASMLPVVVVLVVASLFAYKFIVPPIERFIHKLIERAKEELATEAARKVE